MRAILRAGIHEELPKGLRSGSILCTQREDSHGQEEPTRPRSRPIRGTPQDERRDRRQAERGGTALSGAADLELDGSDDRPAATAHQPHQAPHRGPRAGDARSSGALTLRLPLPRREPLPARPAGQDDLAPEDRDDGRALLCGHVRAPALGALHWVGVRHPEGLTLYFPARPATTQATIPPDACYCTGAFFLNDSGSSTNLWPNCIAWASISKTGMFGSRRCSSRVTWRYMPTTMATCFRNCASVISCTGIDSSRASAIISGDTSSAAISLFLRQKERGQTADRSEQKAQPEAGRL